MDALIKFLNKKKADFTFTWAGPGQRLSGTLSSAQGPRAPPPRAGQSDEDQASIPSHPPSSTAPTNEILKFQAAQAALARIEKEKAKERSSDPSAFLSNRQLAFIKEQAKKESGAEQSLEEMHLDNKLSQQSEEAESSKQINADTLAVSGVYFSCPKLGSKPLLPRYEIESKIQQFLFDRPAEELGVTSCLMIHSCNKGRDKINACVETLCKYLDNILQNPEDTKFHKIRCSNAVFQEKVAPAVGATQFLQAAGFAKQLIKPDGGEEEEEFYVFKLEENVAATLTKLRDTLKNTAPIRPELDRNIQVLMPAQVVQRQELPDEFYTLTQEELKREQKLRAELSERELTLRTKAQREGDELREQSLYRYAVIRIRFPDGLTLQGTFGARERIGDIYDFVHENLALGDIAFSLKKSLGDTLSKFEATLLESALAPTSVIKFERKSAGWRRGEMSFLKSDTLALVQTQYD